jgi:antitoxin component YwqK of YwqJK toxin-antitoxin module
MPVFCGILASRWTSVHLTLRTTGTSPSCKTLAEIMRTTITILTFFAVYLCNAQVKSNVVNEKWYHPNGKVQIECDFDTILNCYAGKFKEYDTTGIMIAEGNYKIVDSVGCKDCYDGFSGKWSKYEYADIRNVPIGEWKYYHSNGQIKMKGTYSELVHAYCGDPNLFGKTDIGPINVWIHYDLLKNGQWVYFDENGIKNKMEEYIDGTLIYIKE